MDKAGELKTGELPALSRRNYSDPIFSWSVRLIALLVPLLIVGFGLELYAASAAARRRFGWHFLFSSSWNQITGHFGAWPFIYGTLLTTVLALLLAAPLGIAVAIFMAELAPDWLRAPVGYLIELLAAVPSVVYGLWGIFVLAPYLQNHLEPWLKAHLGGLPLFRGSIYGLGYLAAGVILAIMVVPFIIGISRQVIAAVPVSQREAAYALAATRWDAIWDVVLPGARSGIAGGVLLGMARALGETMAVTMVIGNRASISASLFAPGYTLASVVANEFSEAIGSLYISSLMEIGLILFGITLLSNSLARLMIWRITRGAGQEPTT